MKKIIRTYHAKTLFSGVVVGKEDKKFVGVPGGQNFETKSDFSNEKPFMVEYDNKRMKIDNWHKAEAFRKFDDKQGRGQYTLGYFEWKPDVYEEEYTSAIQAFANMPEEMKDKLREKLGLK